jgi:hypothetical protein
VSYFKPRLFVAVERNNMNIEQVAMQELQGIGNFISNALWDQLNTGLCAIV